MADVSPNRKVILYISMSLDGYLATKDDGLDWLSVVEREGEDYGYADFTKNVDTYIVGRTTYETVKQLLGGDFPQAQQYDCYVLTRQSLTPEPGITFYGGDLRDLIQRLKSELGKNIYCDGGATVVKLFAEHDLIDEYIIS
ncbi:MAG: dihydrofolate reductase family protein, partial [Bacteroidota bacterium]